MRSPGSGVAANEGWGQRGGSEDASLARWLPGVAGREASSRPVCWGGSPVGTAPGHSPGADGREEGKGTDRPPDADTMHLPGSPEVPLSPRWPHSPRAADPAPPLKACPVAPSHLEALCCRRQAGPQIHLILPYHVCHLQGESDISRSLCGRRVSTQGWLTVITVAAVSFPLPEALLQMWLLLP